MQKTLRGRLGGLQGLASLVLVFPIFFSGLIQSRANADDKPKLTIGSKAPSIDIEHWFSTGDFDKVTRLRAGKIYVIEFWATWCPPCRKAIPRIAKLQEKFASQDVQIISVTREDTEAVEKFLAKKVPGDSKKTFGEVTESYCLTADPDKSVTREYFYAAKQTSIPTAFIVGRTGRIEWIGSPFKMEKPLEQIVADKWDRPAFKKSFQTKLRLKQDKKKLASLVKEKKHAEAAEYIGTTLKHYSGVARQKKKIDQFEMMLAGQMANSEKQFKKLARDFKDSAELQNSLAWSVVEAKQKDDKVPASLVIAARKTMERCTKIDVSAAALDTLAHLYHLEGDLDNAIDTQSQAVAKATGKLKPGIEKFLEQLKTELANQ